MICCPHCGKELDTTTCVNPQVNVGCQPTWQGGIAFTVADAEPIQFPASLQTTVCAGAVVNPSIFQVIVP